MPMLCYPLKNVRPTTPAGACWQGQRRYVPNRTAPPKALQYHALNTYRQNSAGLFLQSLLYTPCQVYGIHGICLLPHDLLHKSKIHGKQQDALFSSLNPASNHSALHID